MPKPRKSRAKERFGGPEFAPYVKAIGQFALAWNDLHLRLGFLFDLILGSLPHNVAQSIWNSSNQDRATRKMLEAILDEIPLRWLSGFPDAQEDVEWILNRANSLEDLRNDVMHSPVWAMGYKPSEAPSLGNLLLQDVPLRVDTVWITGNKRAAKFEGKDFLKEIKWGRDATLIVRDFAVDVHSALRSPAKPGSWPKRPAMPNRGQRKPHQSRPASQAKPPRLHRSSRA